MRTAEIDRADRLARGSQSEDEVAAWLRSNRWTVDLYGARALPETHSLISATSTRLRHAPDLIAALGRRVMLVEVVDGCRPLPADGYRALMLAKLQACDVWAQLAPVLFIDWTNHLSWWHNPAWAHRCKGDVRDRDQTGDHMPYVRVRRLDEMPLDTLTGIAP